MGLGQIGAFEVLLDVVGRVSMPILGIDREVGLIDVRGRDGHEHGCRSLVLFPAR